MGICSWREDITEHSERVRLASSSQDFFLFKACSESPSLALMGPLWGLKGPYNNSDVPWARTSSSLSSSSRPLFPPHPSHSSFSRTECEGVLRTILAISKVIRAKQSDHVCKTLSYLKYEKDLPQYLLFQMQSSLAFTRRRVQHIKVINSKRSRLAEVWRILNKDRRAWYFLWISSFLTHSSPFRKENKDQRDFHASNELSIEIWIS